MYLAMYTQTAADQPGENKHASLSHQYLSCTVSVHIDLRRIG